VRRRRRHPKKSRCAERRWALLVSPLVEQLGRPIEEVLARRWARAARMLTLPDGTTQIQQLIIGGELVGLRAFA
jgi:alkylation response protein AidB-like acyl-CoA dehydrogenase